MTDVVVSVSEKKWYEWLAEGDLPGDPPSGVEHRFWLVNRKPARTEPGDRCYIVCKSRLRGYAPITRIGYDYRSGRHYIAREGGAVACTIPERIRGFRGFRYRWWERSQETPFPEWRNVGGHVEHGYIKAH